LCDDVAVVVCGVPVVAVCGVVVLLAVGRGVVVCGSVMVMWRLRGGFERFLYLRLSNNEKKTRLLSPIPHILERCYSSHFSN
jgi:hypothetical protein